MILALFLASSTLLEQQLAHARTHINVPGTVRVRVEERYPYDKTYPAESPIAWVHQEWWGYLITIRRSQYVKMKKRDVYYSLFHELCHAAYDYDVIMVWGSLSEQEVLRREQRAISCGLRLLREHERKCEGY